MRRPEKTSHSKKSCLLGVSNAFGQIFKNFSLKAPKQVYEFVNTHLILVVLIVALSIRLTIVLTSNFPLNDGGLFYTMVNDLESSNFKLPIYTSYNNIQIPFAYPPLSFFLAAFLERVFPISLIDIFRFLPALTSVLCVALFYLISQELFDKKLAILSALVFALYPRSFIWIIMGGGVARSLGFLFALLTLFFTIRLFKNESGLNFFLAFLFFSFSILTHLEWAFFSLYSMIFIPFIFNKNPRVLKKVFLIVVFSFFITSFWWLTIIKRHTFLPFLAFLQSGVAALGEPLGTYARLFALAITDEPFLTIWGVLILLGIGSCLANKRFVLALWFILPIIFVPRSSPNLVVVPAVFLINHSLSKIILPAFAKKKTSNLKIENPLNFFLIFILFYLVASIFSLAVFDGEGDYFDSVSKPEREAMEWIRQNTKTYDRFLVLSKGNLAYWGMDATSEWFPALTQRESITTPQGAEWLAQGEFRKRVELYTQVKRCYDKDLSCIEDVVNQNSKNFSHIFIYKPSKNEKDYLPLVRFELFHSPKYELVFENSKALVFYRKN